VIEATFVFRKIILKKIPFKFSCIYLLLVKLIDKKYFSVNKKYFFIKKNLILFLEKYFSYILNGKYFLKIMKKLKYHIIC